MIPLRDLNESRRTPVVTYCLIGVNALLFLYELSLGGARLEAFLRSVGFVPAHFFELPLVTALVYGGLSGGLSMFLHGGVAHFLGNMLYLYIFGDNVEDRLGHLRFLVFYLGTGYAATAVHALTSTASTVPTIGASGAISGVLGAYLVLYPRARVVTLLFLGFFIHLVEIPALVYLPFWFLLQLFSGVASIAAAAGSAQAGGVAWFAHVGGFVAGPALLAAFGAWPQGTRRRQRPARRFPDP